MRQVICVAMAAVALPIPFDGAFANSDPAIHGEWYIYSLMRKSCVRVQEYAGNIDPRLAYVDTPEKFAQYLRDAGHPGERLRYARGGLAAIVENASKR
ncbi:hypothetical protein K788_00000230 [Paraburkholderia caribensis MBA4]|uniref:Uncharacterized protein n=1 Tax=Paraburkholderia caribensis MBA4 TaxID=1323664 RepID=A0A0P0RJI5_9BURK|nr:hypothetical protein K788_00000230 [Paraburkholderia caribensis MBA4]